MSVSDRIYEYAVRVANPPPSVRAAGPRAFWLGMALGFIWFAIITALLVYIFVP